MFCIDFEKKKRLLEAYGIPMEEKLREDVMEMCNLSKGIEERGVQKGIQQGMQQGITKLVKSLLELNHSNDTIIRVLMEQYGLTEAEANKYL